MLEAFVTPAFYNRHVYLPANEVTPEILHNPKFYPYFEDCRAAVDGSLLPAHFPAALADRARCRKGNSITF